MSIQLDDWTLQIQTVVHCVTSVTANLKTMWIDSALSVYMTRTLDVPLPVHPSSKHAPSRQLTWASRSLVPLSRTTAILCTSV
jgi:hypothetical protein